MRSVINIKYDFCVSKLQCVNFNLSCRSIQVLFNPPFSYYANPTLSTQCRMESFRQLTNSVVSKDQNMLEIQHMSQIESKCYLNVEQEIFTYESDKNEKEKLFSGKPPFGDGGQMAWLFRLPSRRYLMNKANPLACYNNSLAVGHPLPPKQCPAGEDN